MISDEKLEKQYMRVKSKHQLSSDLASGKNRREESGVSQPRSTLGSPSIEGLKPKITAKWEDIDPEAALWHPAHPDPLRQMDMEEFTNHAGEMFRDPRITQDQKKIILDELSRRSHILDGIKAGAKAGSKYHQDLSDLYQVRRRGKKADTSAPVLSTDASRLDPYGTKNFTPDQLKEAALAEQSRRQEQYKSSAEAYRARVAEKQKASIAAMAQKAAATGQAIDMPSIRPEEIQKPAEQFNEPPASVVVRGGRDSKAAEKELIDKFNVMMNTPDTPEHSAHWLAEAGHTLATRAIDKGSWEDLKRHFAIDKHPDGRWRLQPITSGGTALLNHQANLLKQQRGTAPMKHFEESGNKK